MKTLEVETAKRQGIPSYTLMDRAGGGVFRVAFSLLASSGGVRAVIICGKGNNGGDGFITGELLAQSGFKVSIFSTGALTEIEGDAAHALKPLIGSPIEPVALTDDESFARLGRAVERADLVVDAILGTGAAGGPRGAAKTAIEVINEAALCPVLSVDIPSGIDADTGSVAGEAIRADVTATIGLPKIGLFLYPAASYVGEMEIIDISIPVEAAAGTSYTSVSTLSEIARLLPKRAPDAHKGSVGVVGIIAGSRGMIGAPALASQAALRAGSGMVHLFAPESLIPSLEAKLTEVIMYGVPESTPGILGTAGLENIVSSAQNYDVVLVGPGLRQHPGTSELVRGIAASLQIGKLVLDADGINAFSGDPAQLKERHGDTVITPHPGEFAKLMGIDSAEVQSDRLGWARRAAERFSVTVVLKGARTVVASKDGRATIITTGNSGLASAGTGDVLSGMISGIWAQGAGPYESSVLGAYLHGLAGDFAASELSEYAMIASDLLYYIPSAILKLAEAAIKDGTKGTSSDAMGHEPKTSNREAQ